MDLTGLSALLSNIEPGYQRGYDSRMLNKGVIDAQQLRNRQLHAELGVSIDPSTFDAGPPSYMPSYSPAAPPGVSSQPVTYPPAGGGAPPSPAAFPASGNGPASAPVAIPGPEGGGPSQAPPGGLPPLPGQSGSLSLGQIFARLKRDPRNSGIPDQVLFQTAANAQKAMLGDDRLLLQYLMNNQRIQGRHEDVATQQAGAGARTAATQAGANQRATLRAETQTKIADQRIDAAASKARDQKQAKVVATKYKELVNKRQQIEGEIAQAQSDPNADNAKIQQLYGQRRAIEDQMIALWQRQGQQLGMPSPSAVLAPDIGTPGGSPATPPAATPAAPEPAPSPAPPPPSPRLDSSTPPPTATDAKGNRVQWNGTTWVPVTAAPAAAQ